MHAKSRIVTATHGGIAVGGDLVGNVALGQTTTIGQSDAKKIKVLFLAANPASTTRLGLDEEIRSITEKIRAADYRDSLVLVSAWAVRPDDLLQSLNEQRPHIVHFSGHGNATGEIVLVDAFGGPRPISTNAMTALFGSLKDNIRVVILNACYSQRQAKALSQVVDVTIGMSSAIEDRGALAFSASFYRALGFGRSIRDAFDQGCTALLLEGILQDKVPTLLVRSGVDPSSMILIKP